MLACLIRARRADTVVSFVSLALVSLSLVGVAVAKEPAPEPVEINQSDWPWWRGPQLNGHAVGAIPVTTWSQRENLVWSAAIPGRGHGSPIVVDNQVLLATANHDTKQQLVLCFDRTTGKQLWSTAVHQGGLSKKGNKKASQASSSLACDGQQLYISFLNRRAIYTTALTRQGKILWQTKISDYVVHQGYGASPAIHGPLVIVPADNKGGGKIAALNRKTGKIVWERDRPKTPNYASPVIFKLGGRQQLLFSGCNLVTSLDPLTGKPLWEIAGSTTECVTTIVTDGTHVYTSGGYPKNHVAAVLADGSGKTAWQKPSRVYVPSMLVKDNFLYAVMDAGIATCWDAKTGEVRWQQRLKAGGFTASPVLIGGLIFATSERGITCIFKATPTGYEEVGRCELGDQVYATPTICGGRIYMRVAEQTDGQRQERLYCIGNAQ